MAGSLVGWIARAYGPVRGALNAPNLARYRPRPLATGPPTLADVASLAERRTNPATGPPRARTAQTNSVAKRGCSRGPSDVIPGGKEPCPSGFPLGRLPAVRLPLGAARHATCMGELVGGLLSPCFTISPPPRADTHRRARGGGGKKVKEGKKCVYVSRARILPPLLSPFLHLLSPPIGRSRPIDPPSTPNPRARPRAARACRQGRGTSGSPSSSA